MAKNIAKTGEKWAKMRLLERSSKVLQNKSLIKQLRLT
jgi:hypothetical protein